ncbi:MAG: GLPGLI family protein [Leeuwenhoekiella sp.]
MCYYQKYIRLTLIFLSVFHLVAAQKHQKITKIKYKLYLNTESPRTKEASLLINENLTQSLFYEINENYEDKILEDDGKIKIQLGSKSTKFNYTDFTKNKLISGEQVFSKGVNVLETRPTLNWILRDSVKIIGGNTCHLGETTFRGRNYIAWYAPELPFKSGPWKFSGLPGLILEIQDESARYVWKAEKVENIIGDFQGEVTRILSFNGRQLPLKNYVLEDKSRFREKILKVLPRGANNLEFKTPRNGKELIYEWEVAAED